jgi:hypothetical protein
VFWSLRSPFGDEKKGDGMKKIEDKVKQSRKKGLLPFAVGSSI